MSNDVSEETSNSRSVDLEAELTSNTITAAVKTSSKYPRVQLTLAYEWIVDAGSLVSFRIEHFQIRGETFWL